VSWLAVLPLWRALSPRTHSMCCVQCSLRRVNLRFVRTLWPQIARHTLCVQVYSSMRHAAACLGFRRLYNGIIPATVQVMPYMGLNVCSASTFLCSPTICFEVLLLRQFGLYELFGILLGDEGGTAAFERGALSGSLSKLMVYPLDTVKRQLQVRHLCCDLGDSCDSEFPCSSMVFNVMQSMTLSERTIVCWTPSGTLQR
jgi:hypothetical protein